MVPNLHLPLLPNSDTSFCLIWHITIFSAEQFTTLPFKAAGRWSPGLGCAFLCTWQM